ncbi:VOC family protein [Rhodococcus wratislaviensis]
MTTRVLSVSVPVADQNAALRFYTEVLGCELRTDVEVWPGARLRGRATGFECRPGAPTGRQ